MIGKLKYLALADDGLVVAVFLYNMHAEVFCRENDFCMMPFNTANRFKEPCPEVGTIYKA